MAFLTDSSSVNLPPDTIENCLPDISDMNRPIANSKDVVAPEVQTVESADGTMNTSRRPRLVRRVVPTPGTTKAHWEVAAVATNIPQMRSSKLVRRVTTAPVRKSFQINSPPHSPTSSKSIRIMMGATVGLPAASLFINRSLHHIATMQTVVITKAVNTLRFSSTCSSAACSLQSTSHCNTSSRATNPAVYFTICMWPFVLSPISSIYCVLSLRVFTAFRGSVDQGLVYPRRQT
ncbi:hypothetical protein B0H14DRAFT_3489092 [Mycena olivaceomarginata]|nr:hypothetical protein B0H14DRAFT_3489092 [Mycena olivaceomarginata]